MRYGFYVIAFVFFLPVASRAQFWTEEDTSLYSGTSDLHYHRRPAISLSVGVTRMGLENLSGTFASPPIAEVRLGRASEWTITDPWKNRSSTGILKEEAGWISLANVSTEIGNKSTSSDINTDTWRIGAGAEQGYGYSLGSSSAIVPYNSMMFDWSRLRLIGASLASADSTLLAPFDGTFRFGTSVQGGVRVQFVPLIGADVSYERAIVFPAHLFWKWAGSTIIEVASQTLVDEFVNRVMDNSPAAVPVVSFVLKSGISYGIYELRKEKMNWPFDSDPPLRFDSFKAGLSFVF